MSVELKKDDKKIIAFLKGDIDHHTAAPIRSKIDEIISLQKPSLLIIDFNDVSFMDSSGIGLVLGRYRLMNELGGKVRVENLSKSVYKVMSLSGMDKLVEIKKREEEKNENN
ncbi:MAG: anti-sigma factor antagonist [Clostridiales bacterium]|nr:anti-sigma factor antagonist [Clostridiales bacterium]